MSEVISLILHIQNDEAKINLSLDEQPDLKEKGFGNKKVGLKLYNALYECALKKGVKKLFWILPRLQRLLAGFTGARALKKSMRRICPLNTSFSIGIHLFI